MADVKVSLDIKRDEINEKLASLKDERNGAVKKVIADFRERGKALRKQLRTVNHMMKTAEKAEI